MLLFIISQTLSCSIVPTSLVDFVKDSKIVDSKRGVDVRVVGDNALRVQTNKESGTIVTLNEAEPAVEVVVGGGHNQECR